MISKKELLEKINYQKTIYIGKEKFTLEEIINRKKEYLSKDVKSLLTIFIDSIRNDYNFYINTRFREDVEHLDGIYTIFETSGSTGKPKLVLHESQKFLYKCYLNHKKDHSKDKPELVILSPYHIAWWEAVVTCLFNSRECYIYSFKNLFDIKTSMPLYIKCTPTIAKLFIAQNINTDLSNIMFLIGSEPVDKQLHHSIVHSGSTYKIIYGSTETMGIPLVTKKNSSYFSIPSDLSFSIEDGIFCLKNWEFIYSYIMLDDKLVKAENNYNTNDIFQLEPLGYKIIGRKSSLVKVSGRNVSLIYIRNKILSFEGINEATVYLKSDNLMGDFIACDVVLSKEIKSFNKNKLRSIFEQSYMRPVEINILEKIEITNSLKRKLK